MDIKQLIMNLRQIVEEKNLVLEIVQDALEQAIAAAYRKDYGSRDQEVRAHLNQQKGDFDLFISKEVVDEVEDEHMQVTLKEAKKHTKDAALGDMVEYQVDTQDFGRVAAQTAKQVILQKLREAEREVIHAEFSDRIGTILQGTVQRIEPRVVYVDLGKAQGILPSSEQIPGEYYRNTQRLKVYLRDVENTTRGPQLVLSRANSDFVALLFEREVPEMENKSVEIKVIAREAGVRTKVAVASNVPGVDPVGTFVGGHGTRVQAVMNEIGEEKIDIIPYSEDHKTFITNALSPTKITKVELDEAEHKARVLVPEDQLSVAIGKHGQNVRLASKVTGWQIDIIGSATQAAETKTEGSQTPVKPEQTKKKLASKADLESSLLEALEQTEEK